LVIFVETFLSEVEETGHLTAFMVSPEEQDVIPIAYFDAEEKDDNFY